MQLNQLLQEGRKLKNLTQADVGEHIGVTKQTISQYEKGYIKPADDTLEKLVKLLSIDLSRVKKQSNTATYTEKKPDNFIQVGEPQVKYNTANEAALKEKIAMMEQAMADKDKIIEAKDRLIELQDRLLKQQPDPKPDPK